MKDKKIKKIIEIALQEFKKNNNDEQCIKSQYYTADWAEYDQEVSFKLKKMVLNLLDYRNNVNININNNSFTISTQDISEIKKTKSSNNNNNNNNNQKVNYSEDNYLSIEILKDVGFTINKGYNVRSQFLDPKIYEDILPIANLRLREINNENFSEIWSLIMKESGMIRESNINELFGK